MTFRQTRKEDTFVEDDQSMHARTRMMHALPACMHACVDACAMQLQRRRLSVGNLVIRHASALRRAPAHGDAQRPAHVLIVPVAYRGLHWELGGLRAACKPPGRECQRQLGAVGIHRALGTVAFARSVHAQQVQAVHVPVLVGAHPAALQPVWHIPPWRASICASVCVLGV
jgi:hypothetical protein